ncbi:MAG: hypothetical protein NTW13_02710, partial [Candidatus Omnitrophica bacterium]|nr:hypothetical protein [Candidatus Omnitrophota bacterium]
MLLGSAVFAALTGHGFIALGLGAMGLGAVVAGARLRIPSGFGTSQTTRGPPEHSDSDICNKIISLSKQSNLAAVFESRIKVLLNNPDVAILTELDEEAAARALYHHLIQVGLIGKAVRREDDDYLVALLKNLIRAIKSRNIKDIKGRYFRAAQLIASRFGLPYTSEIQLAAALILLNETEDFIQALKEENFVKAELAADAAGINQVVEFVDVQKNVVNHGLLRNLAAALTSIAKVKYATGLSLVINAIRVEFGSARANIISIIDAVAAIVSEVLSSGPLQSENNKESASKTQATPVSGARVTAKTTDESANGNAFLNLLRNALLAIVRALSTKPADSVKDGSVKTTIIKDNTINNNPQAPPLSARLATWAAQIIKRWVDAIKGGIKNVNTYRDERRNEEPGSGVPYKRANVKTDPRNPDKIRGSRYFAAALSAITGFLGEINFLIRRIAGALSYGVRAPPTNKNGAVVVTLLVVLSIISIFYGQQIYQIALNPTNTFLTHLTQPLTILSVAGILVAAMLLRVAQEPSSREMTPLVAALTTIIIGGVLCALLNLTNLGL